MNLKTKLISLSFRFVFFLPPASAPPPHPPPPFSLHSAPDWADGNLKRGKLFLGYTQASNDTNPLCSKSTPSCQAVVPLSWMHSHRSPTRPTVCCFLLSACFILFIYCWLIAQSTAQGHLTAFHKFKFHTQVQYNTKHAHYINVKHTNIIQKIVPSVSLS